MAEPARTISYGEYLDLERLSEEKHEFIDGMAVAMAGGSIEHGRLASRLAHLLSAALEGRACGVYSSDVRIRIPGTGRSTYPDLNVVRTSLERAADDAEAIVNPTVIVEVLSESTERSDRGEKFAHYRRIPSLKEYVLVSQDERRIEIFRREGERWVLDEFLADGSVVLDSLDVEFPLASLYDDPIAD